LPLANNLAVLVDAEGDATGVSGECAKFLDSASFADDRLDLNDLGGGAVRIRRGVLRNPDYFALIC
jgi:hypothetical protein